METQKVQALYDEQYARAYDERFIHDKDYKDTPEFEVKILDRLLNISDNWLDAGCGTGYFLSKFPEKKRAGFDLSEGMLKVAREANPNALFMDKGDFREPHPEWNNQWDLVSCMWCAYSYVESMTEIDLLIRNLSEWTKEGGMFLLPICDLEDVLYWRGELKHHNPDIEIFGGPCYINGVVWSYTDSKLGKHHENLISPHIEYLKKLLLESFTQVETIYYPPYPFPIPGQRKALLAIGKKQEISAEKRATLTEVLELSKTHKANVLTMAQVEQMRAAQNEQTAKIKTAPIQVKEVQTGWLRTLWHKLPMRIRKVFWKLIGE